MSRIYAISSIVIFQDDPDLMKSMAMITNCHDTT